MAVAHRKQELGLATVLTFSPKPAPVGGLTVGNLADLQAAYGGDVALLHDGWWLLSADLGGKVLDLGPVAEAQRCDSCTKPAVALVDGRFVCADCAPVGTEVHR